MTEHPLLARYAALPSELRALPQWVVWKREVRKGKPQKVPYNPKTGGKADTTDPLTWASFEDAIEALEWDASYAGIGFVFRAGGGIFGLDIDACRDPQTGEIDAEARSWLDRLNTYTEISPSGKGVHAIGYGALPGPGIRRGRFELYDQGRFFTITGRRVVDGSGHEALPPRPLTESNGALGSAYSTLETERSRGRGQPAASGAVGTSILSDADVLNKAVAAANGAKFAALWAGDTSAHGGDASASDQAIANLLAFWTRCDGDQMDRLFRASGLMRDKWDERRGRATYGQRTIAAAIRGTTQMYEPAPHATLVAGDEDEQEDQQEDEEEHEDAPEPAPSRPNLTDLGNARRLAAHYGQDLRYVAEWGWLGWDGTRWRRDATGVAERYARRVVDDLYREARALRRKKLTKQAGAMMKWALQSEASSRLDAMVHQARFDPGIVARVEQFDTDPWLLNCANGTLDLRSGALRPHAREDFATRATPVAYDPSATAPRWHAFLERILPDPAVRAFVQRCAGYTLTGSTDEQCLLFLYGSGGNGKSTLLSLLRRMLGDFATQTAPETLLVKQQGSIPNDIAMLAGCRLVITIEVEDGKRLAESLIKSLTGQDAITARFMRKEFFTFDPVFKVWLAANHKPIIRGTDHAIWRRIHLIPFTQLITPEERKANPHIHEQLAAELPGILTWAVNGCLAWQANGLCPPDAVSQATARYRSEMDMLLPFLDACCDLGTDGQTYAGPIYQAYLDWCKDNGDEPLKQRTFGMKLSERGLERDRGTNGRHVWRGVALRAGCGYPHGVATLANDPMTHNDPDSHIAPTHARARSGEYRDIGHYGSLGHSGNEDEEQF